MKTIKTSKRADLEVKIYNDFNIELRNIWKEFYTTIGGNYNLSFDWCYIWFKYYGQDKKPFIISLWKDNEIKLLAPFYIFADKLYLIGSYPDLYDEFNIIFKEKIYINDLVHYIIFEKKYCVDFKFINTDSEFAKIFMQKISDTPFLRTKIYGFVPKPSVDLNIEFKKRLTGRIKRGQSKAKTKYNKEIALEFISARNKDTLDEFITLHKNRWNGGWYTQENVEDFTREIFLSTDLVLLARLYFKEDNRTIAYDFIYKDSSNRLWGNQAAHNSQFLDISPSILNTGVTQNSIKS